VPMRVVAKNSCRVMVEPPEKGAGPYTKLSTRLNLLLSNVAYWHHADAAVAPLNVRFRGKSGHRNFKGGRSAYDCRTCGAGWERAIATGSKAPAISFVTGTGPMVRSSSEGFDQWAFAIDQRRRALLGKMDMLKG
jgi:hypothetical protein